MLTIRSGSSAQKNYFWHTVFLCAVTALCIYLPYVILDASQGSFFHYAGDFNSQQITFYSYANQFIKSGGSFSWETDLGSGFANAYSFYLLGSPFFWLSCLFPARLTPYLMIPMLALKYGVAGGGAYLWLRRYTRRTPMAVVGACLYALSGFTVYNAFFNHFVDVIALFPYLLWALDEAVHEGRKGAFAFFVALNLLNNYFFFVGQALFLVIYFVCQWLSGSYRVTSKKFGYLAFESILGCCMGCLLVIPAFLSLMQNPRTVDVANGYGLLTYGSVQQYLAIFFSFFLVPDAPYMTMWSEGIIKWTSLTAYLPLCSCAGAIAWLKNKNGTAFKRILCTCLCFAFVPVLNSAFYMLNSSFYARWYYMPLLIMAAVTVVGLEDQTVDVLHGVSVALVCSLCSMVFALVPARNEEDDGWVLGVVKDPLRFWALLALTVAGLLAFGYIVFRWRGRRRFASRLLAGVLAFSMLYGWVHVGITKLDQQENDRLFARQCYSEGPLLGQNLAELSGGSFARFDAYKCYDNLSLWAQSPCIRFFGSTVMPSILDFYPKVGVTRDVNSKPDYDLYALRGLLSVRYTVLPEAKKEDFLEENLEGWTFVEDRDGYSVYENENYVPMGFTYQNYITQTEFGSHSKANGGNLLMRALLLSDEQIETYGAYLQPLTEDELNALTYGEYQSAVADRRAHTCSSFVATNTGFEASITLDEPNLVFFSVPYSEGFTATVNGEAVPVENVDNGLMAVLCPAGESNIEFVYKTPGMAASGALSGAGCLVFIVYLAAIYRRRKHSKEI